VNVISDVIFVVYFQVKRVRADLSNDTSLSESDENDNTNYTR